LRYPTAERRPVVTRQMRHPKSVHRFVPDAAGDLAIVWFETLGVAVVVVPID